VETDLTERLSGAVAVRYEDHDVFGSTTDGKLSARFQATDHFAVRGTFNTGFRVPTPGQVNTLNVTTSADSNGNLIPSGFYPIDHPVAVALGAVPQQTEESTSFTVGLVWEVADNVSLTVDFYDIDIDDRIGTLDTVVDQAAVDALNAAGYPDANLLLNTAASFFSNAFDSEVSGVDLTLDTYFDVMGGVLNASYRHNHNDQKVTNIKPSTINASRAYDLENQVPNDQGVLNLDFARDNWGGTLRFNYYGGWSTTPGLFSAGDASDAANYGSEILVDLEARFAFTDAFSIAVGGDNIFDTYPDKEADGTFQFLGAVYAVTSPFGFNGAFWYARANFEF
jgi:iron complex outermembrane receptor protein